MYTPIKSGTLNLTVVSDAIMAIIKVPITGLFHVTVTFVIPFSFREQPIVYRLLYLTGHLNLLTLLILGRSGKNMPVPNATGTFINFSK